MFRKINKLKLIILLLLIFLAYSNTLNSPFILDDIGNVYGNSSIEITQFTPETIAHAAFSGPSPSRPIANLSFALDYYFNKGFSLFSLHLTNIFIHSINAILLYVFLALTFKTPALKNYSTRAKQWIPLLTATLWAVHPLHTQSVTYIVQRMNSLAVLFYLLTFICYINARFAHNKSHSMLLTMASLLTGAMAIGSKEISATLPFFILLYEFFFFQDLHRAWLKQKAPLLTALFIGTLVLLFVKYGFAFWNTIPESYQHRDFTLTQRLLTQPRVILFYLSLFFWPLPSRLNLEHDFPLSQSLTDPATTIPAIFSLGLLVILARLITRKYRLFAFAILWFLGNLAIESSFIPLEIIFEHRTYLPLMMVTCAIVTLLVQYVPFRTLIPATLILTAMLSLGTYERNKVWKNELSLLLDCVNKSPNKARPLYNLGITNSELGKPNEAIIYYRRALEAQPKSASINTNLGIDLLILGNTAEAVFHFRQALTLVPDFPMAHLYLGIASIAANDTATAFEHLKKATKFKETALASHEKLGELYLLDKKPECSIQHFEYVLKNDKNNQAALKNINTAKHTIQMNITK